jgi:hypothetical protein
VFLLRCHERSDAFGFGQDPVALGDVHQHAEDAARGVAAGRGAPGREALREDQAMDGQTTQVAQPAGRRHHRAHRAAMLSHLAAIVAGSVN